MSNWLWSWIYPLKIKHIDNNEYEIYMSVDSIDLYDRQHEVVLGEITTTIQYNFYKMHNCTFMPGYNGSNWYGKNTK